MEKDHLGEEGAERRIILERMFVMWVVGNGLDRS
jgi:hypothetical protein